MGWGTDRAACRAFPGPPGPPLPASWGWLLCAGFSEDGNTASLEFSPACSLPLLPCCVYFGLSYSGGCSFIVRSQTPRSWLELSERGGGEVRLSPSLADPPRQHLPGTIWFLQLKGMKSKRLPPDSGLRPKHARPPLPGERGWKGPAACSVGLPSARVGP